MPKLNPQQYVKRLAENEKSMQRRLRVANEIVEKRKLSHEESGGKTSRRRGPKSKKEKEVEARLKEQEDFLLFLAREKEKKERKGEAAAPSEE